MELKNDVRQWLADERWNDVAGQPESLSKLIERKLEKLMKLERQGY